LLAFDAANKLPETATLKEWFEMTISENCRYFDKHHYFQISSNRHLTEQKALNPDMD
jgi:hypothetical protein